MRKFMLLVAVALFGGIGFTATTGAQSSAPPQQTATTTPPPAPKPTYWQRHGCSSFVKVLVYKKALHHRIRYSIVDGDFRAKPYTKRAAKALLKLRRCARSPKHRKMMLRAHHRRKAMWKWVAYIDAITPFGKWAVPPAVVGCEGGFHGWSKWNNEGSGAAGPYQLLGHGAPMPANTNARKARHHIIAASLYHASGLGPWAASRSCWG